MELKNYNVYFFFVMLLLISVLTFFIFEPFLISILVAAVLAVIFRPVYGFLLSRLGNRRGLSAMLTSFISILMLLIPFSIILTLVVNEISALYHQISTDMSFYENNISPSVRYIQDNEILKVFGLDDFINRETVTNAISQVGQYSFSFLQTVYQSLINFGFMTFVVFFSLYYFLINGKSVMKRVMSLSPLRDSHEKLLIEKFVSMSRATIKGTLIVAFIQGLIGGLAFAIAGVHSATIWAILMMILSLIPMFGAGIIWFPVAIVMLLTGNVWEGSFILIIGFFVVSLIDNFLRPELVGKDTQMHPLIVFFSTLGGISMFGFLGFIIGPIVVALFLSLWEIYAVEFKKQLKTFNT